MSQENQQYPDLQSVVLGVGCSKPNHFRDFRGGKVVASAALSHPGIEVSVLIMTNHIWDDVKYDVIIESGTEKIRFGLKVGLTMKARILKSNCQIRFMKTEQTVEESVEVHSQAANCAPRGKRRRRATIPV